MKPHLQYLWYVLRHKWFVFVAGLTYGVPLWQLLIHDLSKCSPAEWGPYVAYFYGRDTTASKPVFDRAWNHHQKANPHHWQYWLLTNDQPSKDWVVTSMDGGMLHAGVANYVRYPDRNLCDLTASGEQALRDADELCALLNRQPIALEMPDRYVREMVADWAGAGRTITGRWEVAEWYAKTRNTILLHPNTRARVEALLAMKETDA